MIGRGKTAAYFAAAVLIGFAAMMLPRAVQPKPSTYQAEPDTQNRAAEGYNLLPLDKMGSDIPGLASQPSNLLPSSFIFLTGLVVATAVYIILKKRLA